VPAVRALRRASAWLHRWLGVALGLFFAMWFASGMVLALVPFPRLTAAERFAGLEPLALERCCVEPQAATKAAGLDTAVELRLTMHEGRPAYRLLGGAPARWHTVMADTGEALPPLEAAAAARIAARFAGVPAARTQERLEDDQWTVPQALNPWRPLFKVALEDAAGTELYVSAGSGEVVRDTARSERFWNWLGAVPHWIYPTLLRRHPQAWHEVVVWISIPALVMVAAGIVVGLWSMRAPRRGWTPYREAWMRWHHLLGLAALIVIFTWMLSGLLSMNPFRAFPPRALAAPDAVSLHAPDWAALRAAAPGARELEWRRLGSTPYVVIRRGPADSSVLDQGGRAVREVDPASLREAIGALEPGRAYRLDRLGRYDDYYYSLSAERPLPVLRASFDHGIWHCVDPATGRAQLRLAPGNRVQRWLYNGLHSLDFPALLERPRLRLALLFSFCAVGLALSATGVWLGWRRAARTFAKAPA